MSATCIRELMSHKKSDFQGEYDEHETPVHKYAHECRLPLDDYALQDIVDYYRMLEDLGGNDTRRALEIVKENHRWLKTQRDRGEKLAGIIAILIITALVSGLLSALWMGTKALLGK